MKAGTLKIAALIAAAIFTLKATGSVAFAQEVSQSCKEKSGVCYTQIKDEYDYERVFKDGIWWIYVYDGATLVTCYPE